MQDVFIPWTRLPLSFEPALMQAELGRIPEEDWAPHFNHNDYDGKWSSISLRSRSGETKDSLPVGTADQFRDTTLADACPYLRMVMDKFEFPKKSVRLLRLHAGSRVREHTDADLKLSEGELRIHVPVCTNDGVEFVVADRRLFLREGESWYIDFSQRHWIYNGGETDRVHLVIDGEVNEWSDALLQRSLDRVTETFDPPKHLDFKAFRELVLEDPTLQDELLATRDQTSLFEAIMAAGANRGFQIASGDVQSAHRSGMREWSMRSGQL